MVRLAVVRIRGVTGVKEPIARTLKLLNLHKVNYCTIVEDTPANKGMIIKAKDYITWGEVDDATLKELLTKRGEPNPRKKGHTKPFFRLNPPRKGYGKHGVKHTFKEGGGSGQRGPKINELLKRMI